MRACVFACVRACLRVSACTCLCVSVSVSAWRRLRLVRVSVRRGGPGTLKPIMPKKAFPVARVPPPRTPQLSARTSRSASNISSADVPAATAAAAAAAGQANGRAGLREPLLPPPVAVDPVLGSDTHQSGPGQS
jgi:hypothetical protein